MATAVAEERVALVIGNSAYQHTAPLQNPKHDAVDTAAVLRGLGFRVIEALDLDKAAMDRTIRDFAAALSNAKVGLFFYAGHGLQVSGENYLVPIDAKLETASALEFEGVRVQLVQRVMEGATVTNVLFLDACRDNPLARNLARALGTRSSAIGKGLAPVESGAGTLISFSTQPGNVALDGAGRNSPFAGALVQHLTSSREDLSTILIGVRNMVMADTGNRQVPWEHSALRARFYLHDTPPHDATTAPQPPLSEAAQAWAAIKDSKSEAVLKGFIARYRDSIFAELAGARLKELDEGRGKALAAASTGQPADASASAGEWKIVRLGAGCKPAEYNFRLKVSQQGVVSGQAGAGSLTGSIGSDGKIVFSHPSVFGNKVNYTGILKGASGKGTFHYNAACSGTFTITRN